MELDKEHILEIQAIDAQMKQLEEAISHVDEQIGELQAMLHSMDEFGKLKQGDELLVPVVNGVFVKAKLLDEHQLLVNVGADTVVTETAEQVKELIGKQREEVLQYREKMVEQFQELVDRAKQLDSILTTQQGDG